jgi:hypothetical protein
MQTAAFTRILGIMLAVSVVCGCARENNDSGGSAALAPGAESPSAAPGDAARLVEENPLRNAYFGETHIHTSYSLDAYIGGTRLEPDDAYRFAKGETVTMLGRQYAISKPLDFAAVTDHAEYLGEAYSTIVPGAPGHDQELLNQLRSLDSLEEKQAWFKKYVVDNNRGSTPQHPAFFAGEGTVKSAWQVAIDAAENNNDPGRFTALIGFEWSAAPQGGNLHRNVIFRGARVPDAPVSYIDINREDGLWEWMASLEQQGMRALAIPHNSNASKLLMFAPNDAAGDPIDLEYAQRRQHFEPLIELMQIKGSSEVHRNFWAADEFAGFENADSLAEFSGRTLDPRNFIRHAVIEGLGYEQALGANPYKLGFVGATDNHNGMPADAEEYDWSGGHGDEDGSLVRRRTADITGWVHIRDTNPGALAGVWATANTRAAIWDAMQRRETFATSGPRLQVRFFGGAKLPVITAGSSDYIAQGYDLGVPMGGTLKSLGSAPTFNVHASKDPDGANLDRIQIIKGWITADGQADEKIINVAWSGKRVPDSSGVLPPVGNSVDLATAEYTNSIGSDELRGSWTDDDFDPAQHALYYARVLEIPTPRWTTYEAVRNSLPLLTDVPATIQERVWTSPIWYTP